MQRTNRHSRPVAIQIAAGVASVLVGFAGLVAPAVADQKADESGRSGADRSAGEREAVDVGGEVIEVHGKAPPDSGLADLVGDRASAAAAARALAEPAFVTVVHIDDRAGETATVAEVLAHSMGVNVRSLGGLGGFSSISVRGAAAGHTPVFIDGVPVSRVASVTADLGRFELQSFSELELYRGGVPVDFGGAGLGGALNLETRLGTTFDRPEVWASTGFGAFGARHARTRVLGGDPAGAGYHVAAGYAGATGDFSYFDDNGTNLNPSDDTTASRTNNGYDQADAVARYRARRGPLTWEVGSRSLWKQQGIPGSGAVQSEVASLDTMSEVLDARLERRHPFDIDAAVVRGAVFVLAERQRYRDPDGEIGLAPQNRRYLSLTGGGRVGLTVAVGDHQRLSGGVDAAADYFAEHDLSSDGSTPRTYGARLALGVTAADELGFGAHDRVVAQPGVRLDVMRTDPIADSNSVVGTTQLSPRSDLFVSPRLALRGRVVDGLVVKGSAGWYFRAPTLPELFGDRGFVVGNPDLAPETGRSLDLGVVIAGAHRVGSLDRLYLESAAFVLQPRDTIVMVPTAGLVTVARNLGNAVIRGVEASGSVRIARTATVSANYTLLDSRQESLQLSYDGKALPQRPRHQGYLRVDLAGRLYHHLTVAWADATFTSGNFLDPGNVSWVPGRRFFAAGIKLELWSALVLGIEGKNLADQRIETIALDPPPRPDLTTSPRAVADFYGYPLPGRSLYLSVEWTH